MNCNVVQSADGGEGDDDDDGDDEQDDLDGKPGWCLTILLMEETALQQ